MDSNDFLTPKRNDSNKNINLHSPEIVEKVLIKLQT